MTFFSKVLPAVLAVALSAGSAAAQTVTTPTRNIVEVSGSGIVQVAPDRARMSFAVETQAPSAADASARNAELMDAVVRALRGMRTESLEVETFGYALRPDYAQRPTEPGQPRVISGYTALNNIRVILGDVQAVGRAMDVAIKAGANRVSGLTFEATDTEEARHQALTLAVANARRDAETMAAALGRALGEPLEVRGGVDSTGPQFRGDQAMMAMERAVDTPIEAGNLNVTASVFIRFALGRLLPEGGR